MSFTLFSVIESARSRHAAFYKSRIPSKAVGDFLSEYQNTLLQKCVQRDRQFMAQQMTVMFSLNGATVGAGTGDGLPGRWVGGEFVADARGAGALIEAETDGEDGAFVAQADRVVTSATATSATSTGAGWTVDAFLGLVFEVTQGPGIHQRREIVSNTADTIVWADALETALTTASMFQVVAPAYDSDGDMGVVVDLPATDARQGYLVKLDASGNPYIDFTTPLVADIEVGVPLPPHHALLDGDVIYTDGDRCPLSFIQSGKRYDGDTFPAAVERGNELFFVGDTNDWTDIRQATVRYIPIAPTFTAPLTDVFLLPDSAKPCLVAQAAGFMAMRVAGAPDVTIDAKLFLLNAANAEAEYLSSLRLSRSGRRNQFRS